MYALPCRLQPIGVATAVSFPAGVGGVRTGGCVLTYLHVYAFMCFIRCYFVLVVCFCLGSGQVSV